jgi:hypothetical protein
MKMVNIAPLGGAPDANRSFAFSNSKQLSKLRRAPLKRINVGMGRMIELWYYPEINWAPRLFQGGQCKGLWT